MQRFGRALWRLKAVGESNKIDFREVIFGDRILILLAEDGVY